MVRRVFVSVAIGLVIALTGGCGGGSSSGLPSESAHTGSLVVHWPGPAPSRALADLAASIRVWLEERDQGPLAGTERTLTPSHPETRYDDLTLNRVLRVAIEALDQSGTKIAAGVSEWLTIRPGENRADVSLIQTPTSLDVHISFDDSGNSGADDHDTDDDDDDAATDDPIGGNTGNNGSGNSGGGSGGNTGNNGSGNSGGGSGGNSGGSSGGHTTVSYTNTTKSLIDSRCVSCHQAGGMVSGKPLTTYAEVKKYVDNGKLRSALNGSMSGYAGSDKTTLLDWIANGAPQ